MNTNQMTHKIICFLLCLLCAPALKGNVIDEFGAIFSTSSNKTERYIKPTEKIRLLENVDVYNLAEKVYTLKKGEFVTPLFVQPFKESNKIVVDDKYGNRVEVPFKSINVDKLKSQLLYKNTWNVVYLADGYIGELELIGEKITDLTDKWGEYNTHYYSKEEGQHYYTFRNVLKANSFTRSIGVRIITDEELNVKGVYELDWSWNLFCALPFYANVMSLNLLSGEDEFISEAEFKDTKIRGFLDGLKLLLFYYLIYFVALVLLMFLLACIRFINSLAIFMLSNIINLIVPYVFVISLMEKYQANWFWYLFISILLWAWGYLLAIYVSGLKSRCPRCGKVFACSEKEELYKEEYKSNVSFYKNFSSKYPTVKSYIDISKYYRNTKKCAKCDYDESKVNIENEKLLKCPKCGKPFTSYVSAENISYGEMAYNIISKSLSGGIYTIEYECVYSVECSCGWRYQSNRINVLHKCDKSKLAGNAFEDGCLQDFTSNRRNETGRTNSSDSEQNGKVENAAEKERLMRELNEAYANYESYKNEAENAKSQMETYLREAEYCLSKASDDESYYSTAQDYKNKAEIYGDSYRELSSKADDWYNRYSNIREELTRL